MKHSPPEALKEGEMRNKYHIQPNYHTVRLGFSKLLRKLVVKYVSTYTRSNLKKKDQQRTNLMVLMRCFFFVFFFSDFLDKSICCGYSFELHRHVDAIQMDTHNICLYKEVDKKYTGCNLKTTESLDSVLIGVYVVIRLNTVITKQMPQTVECKDETKSPDQTVKMGRVIWPSPS